MNAAQHQEAIKKDGVFKTACYLCHGGCILLAHVKNGKLVKVTGDPDGPINRGSICEKGNAAVQYVYSPYRLKYPMKRAGERGGGKWKRISWEEALDTTVEKFTALRDKYGGECIAYAWGTARVIHSIPRQNFYNGVLGTPNGIGIGHICLTKTRMPVLQVTLGPLPGAAGVAVMRDFDRSNCIVAWGDTIFDSRNDGMGGMGRSLMNRLENGCKLIVIDPVYTRAASKAHIWLPIRPGTDLALALAWQNIILNEGLYDKAFVEKWTNAPFLVRNDTGKLLRHSDIIAGGNPQNFMVWDKNSSMPRAWDSRKLCYETEDTDPAVDGSYAVPAINGKEIECSTVFQKLKDGVSEWTPEKTAEVTWLDPDKIRASARMFAGSRPACIEWGVSMSQYSRSTATNMALLHLKAITGNLDVPGGNTFWHVPGYRQYLVPVPPEQEKKRITGGYAFSSDKMSTMPSAHQPAVWKAAATGEPYPIRALYGESANPLTTHEKPDRYIIQALQKMEFIVWSDITMTPSTEWADIILPVNTPFERNWLHFLFDKGLFAGRAVIDSVGESRSDFDIFRDLCNKMGRPDLWPWEMEKELSDYKLEPIGINFDKLTETCFYPAPEVWNKHEKGLLRPDKKPGYITPSGKLELFSSIMENADLDPLPVFAYPPESPEMTPDLARAYPYILSTGSRELNFPFFHSQYHFIPWLREIEPYPRMLVHPRTAAEVGLEKGDWAWVETRHGKARFLVEITKRIHPKMLSVPHAWWYPELPAPYHGVFESNANVLVDPEGPTDPATGTTELRGLLCKTYKADGPPEGVAYRKEATHA